MDQKTVPAIFTQLLAEGCLERTDIVSTRDGFFLARGSVADILARRGILDFPDSEGIRHACHSFFDDWFLYAVPDGAGHVCSLLKLREQEQDRKLGIPSDGDTPGVTICFLSLDTAVLLACLREPTDENRARLNREINRVVAFRGQRHHPALKRYFLRPESEGVYLVAEEYAKQIASFARGGVLPVPERYRKLLQKRGTRKGRVPDFVASVNRRAEQPVCDGENIYIRDPAKPDPLEQAVILATHTGNTSLYSFAAEVECHARFLIPLAGIRFPFCGKSLYDSAIRADMTLGGGRLEGLIPFYRPGSPIVRRQRRLHEKTR